MDTTETLTHELFYPEFEDRYILHVQSLGVLNYAFQQSGLPLLDIEFRNNTLERIENLSLKISFDFDFIEPVEESDIALEPGEVYELVPTLRVNGKKLFELTEMVKDHMEITILDSEGEVLVSEEKELPVLPTNQWSGPQVYPESLASFVMPNVPQVQGLLTRATQILKDRFGESSFDGYQSGDKNKARWQAAAIYAAIYEQNIVYVEIPPTFFKLGQRVRTPIEVLNLKQGNCLEMALLYSSLCEAAGLRPFIVLMQGHAFAGVWLVDDMFNSNMSTDIAEVDRRLATGINDLEVIECTLMNSGSDANFGDAVHAARRAMEKESEFDKVIDIYRSHITGIRPMPIRVIENGVTMIYDYGLADDADSKAVSMQTIEDRFLDTSGVEERSKRDIWMRNLLDLSKRNQLISFRAGGNSVQIFTSDLNSLEDALAQGEEFEIREVVDRWKVSNERIQLLHLDEQLEAVAKISEAEFSSKRLRTFLSPKDLEKRLKELYRGARTSLEETGSNTLYMAMGFLRWVDPKDRPDADGHLPLRYAPIVLVPIDLIRKTGGRYSLVVRDEDAQLNITILEMLRQDYDLHIRNLDPLPQDDHGVDLISVFNSIRRAVAGKKHWNVHEIAFLGHFSFTQFVMWNDMRERFDQLTENKVVKALVEQKYIDFGAQTVSEETLDEELKSTDLAIASSVDSSQLAAVVEAAKGSSFILHGPPGTGKSQTITNMIANAMYQGKTILFVAEKMVALNVVQERLDELGLKDFYLELHSNKTNKRQVLDKLENNMKLAQQQDLSLFEHRAKQINERKDVLNIEVAELHAKRSSGFTLYDLINRSLEFPKTSAVLQFPEHQLEALTRENWERWDSAVRRMGRELSYLGMAYDTHPLREFTKDSYSPNNHQALKSDLEEMRSTLSDLRKRLSQLVDHETKEALLDEEGLHELLVAPSLREAITRILEIYAERHVKLGLTREAYTRLLDADTEAVLTRALHAYASYNNGKIKLTEKYNPEIMGLDILRIKTELLEAGRSFMRKRAKQTAVLLQMNSLTRQGFQVTVDNAEEEFDRLSDHATSSRNWLEQARRVDDMLGTKLIDHENPATILSTLLQVREILRNVRLEHAEFTTNEVYMLYRLVPALQGMGDSGNGLFLGQIKRFESMFARVCELTGVRDDLLSSFANLDAIHDMIQRWIEHLDDWRLWSTYCSSLQELKDMGLGIVTDALADGTIAIELGSDREMEAKLFEYFTASLLQGLIRYYFENTRSLSRFKGQEYAHQIHEFNALIDEYEDLSQEQIRIRLSQNVPQVQNSTEEEQSQMAALTRAIRSKGRGMSLRSLFESSGQIIRRMCPVMLMSPLSVAQYIDPAFPKFDLIIFDEASQIRTSMAVGAMSRAENCIIVGDPNQMPPTSFFRSEKVDEDNLHVEDLESVLEDCLAINMPGKHLDWHYRSQSESLIAFSNQQYYKGRLVTFPSPSDKESRVYFHNVKGVYDRGYTRTNRIEAEAIVAEVERRLRDPVLRKDSIGILTFSVAQQNLVDDLLQELFRKQRELDAYAQSIEEGIFIKNLESAQGDERDVILFSIGYGPSEDGKLRMSFGPLGRSGGWRRLNVAASRSRKEMRIYASFEPEEMRITASTSEGVLGLRQFMMFARDGSLEGRRPVEKENQGEVTPLIERVAKFLQEHGYETVSNLGKSKLKVDLAVVNPHEPEQFLCAIMKDGTRYAELKTARDRYRLIPSVLRRIGWDTYSLWTIDWFMDPEAEKEKLLKHLEQLSEEALLVFEAKQEADRKREEELEAIREAAEADLPEAEVELSMTPEPSIDDPEADDLQDERVIDLPSEPVEWQASQVAKQVLVEEEVVDDLLHIPVAHAVYEVYIPDEILPSEMITSNAKDMALLMTEIIELEGPIHEQLLFRRVCDVYSGVRLGGNIRSFLRRCVRHATNMKTTQSSGTIYWPHDAVPGDYLFYRTPAFDAERRDFDVIPEHELANALLGIALDHVGPDERRLTITEDELKREVCGLMGYARYTQNVETLMEHALRLAVRLDYFVVNDDGELEIRDVAEVE